MDTYIKCFLVAAELNSFSEAAKELNLSKQDISRQIIWLEEELGQTLFVRRGSQVSLNEVGMIYYSLFQRLENQFTELQKEIRDVDSISKEIRIGCMKLEGLGDLLTEVMNEFRNENPDINLIWEDHLSTELLPMLKNEKLDVVFVFESLLARDSERTAFQWFATHQTSLILLVSKDHPKFREGATAEDFMSEPCYVPLDMGENIQILKNWLYVSPLVTFDIRIMRNINLIKALVDSGRGITVCPDVYQWVKDPNLVAYPIASKSNVVCVWRRDDRRSDLLALREYISQNVKIGERDRDSQ